MFYLTFCLVGKNHLTSLSYVADDANNNSGARGRRLRRNRDVRCGAATAAGRRVQPRSERLRGRLRPRRAGGHGRRQDDTLRGHADGGRLRAVARVQAGPVGVRGRVVPASGTAARVQPGRAARAHGRAQGHRRRAVRHRAKDLRGRACPRVRALRPGGVPTPGRILQLSIGRPKITVGLQI